MLHIDKQGRVLDKRIIGAIAISLEHGPMESVRGLIVHQTGGPTAKSTLDSYKKSGADGAHFLIDKDGTIYQTASVYKKTYHVGKLKSRCMLEARCSPQEKILNSQWSPSLQDKREMKKPTPDRFPSNVDSIGIELVGEALPRGKSVSDDNKTYEIVTDAQNQSLKWLIAGLVESLKINYKEIFRHPVVSYKNKTEASTAKW